MKTQIHRDFYFSYVWNSFGTTDYELLLLAITCLLQSFKLALLLLCTTSSTSSHLLKDASVTEDLTLDSEHNAPYIWSITEFYTWNQYNFITQCCPNRFNFKNWLQSHNLAKNIKDYQTLTFSFPLFYLELNMCLHDQPIPKLLTRILSTHWRWTLV